MTDQQSSELSQPCGCISPSSLSQTALSERPHQSATCCTGSTKEAEKGSAVEWRERIDGLVNASNSDLIYAIRLARLPDSKWSFDIGTGHLGASTAPGINIKVNQAVAFAANFRF